MLSSSCPKCHAVLNGSFEEIKAHVKSCGKKSKSQGSLLRDLPPVPVVWTPGMTFELPKLVLSQNKTHYAHWRVADRDKKQWMTTAKGSSLMTLEGARFKWSQWKVIREWCPPKRQMDYANFVGGTKPLIDCLVNLGIIYDDAPKFFEATYEQVQGKRNLTILVLQHASYTPKAV